jgi:integrase
MILPSRGVVWVRGVVPLLAGHKNLQLISVARGPLSKPVGIGDQVGCHTFRATGFTDYLTNGGRIEVAPRMAGHSNAKTTGLYERRKDDISVGEVERIGI